MPEPDPDFLHQVAHVITLEAMAAADALDPVGKPVEHRLQGSGNWIGGGGHGDKVVPEPGGGKKALGSEKNRPVTASLFGLGQEKRAATGRPLPYFLVHITS